MAPSACKLSAAICVTRFSFLFFFFFFQFLRRNTLSGVWRSFFLLVRARSCYISRYWLLLLLLLLLSPLLLAVTSDIRRKNGKKRNERERDKEHRVSYDFLLSHRLIREKKINKNTAGHGTRTLHPRPDHWICHENVSVVGTARPRHVKSHGWQLPWRVHQCIVNRFLQRITTTFDVDWPCAV